MYLAASYKAIYYVNTDGVTSLGASQESVLNVELKIGQSNPQSDTEVNCLFVSNPEPVNVTVAPPA
jgi:hypothetical protein